jgi:hypothetical protein
VPIAEEGDTRRVILVGIKKLEEKDIEAFLSNMFDISIDDYNARFKKLMSAAKARKTSKRAEHKAAALLDHVRSDLDKRWKYYKSLSDKSFEYSLLNQAYEKDGGENPYAIYRIGKDNEVWKHLSECGYNDAKQYASLQLYRVDDIWESDTPKALGTLIDYEANECWHVKRPESLRKSSWQTGLVRFINIGEKAILDKEKSLYDRLYSHIEKPDPNNNYLESVLDTAHELMGNLSSPSSSLESANIERKIRPHDISNASPDEVIRSNRKLIVFGAAGTGKTRKTAELVKTCLELHEGRVYPPPRVLVVAATNFALHNFKAAFKKLTNDKRVICHHVTDHQRRESKEISSELLHHLMPYKKTLALISKNSQDDSSALGDMYAGMSFDNVESEAECSSTVTTVRLK